MPELPSEVVVTLATASALQRLLKIKSLSAAESWLHTPNSALGDRVPVEMFQVGNTGEVFEEIQHELNRAASARRQRKSSSE